jgi:hypothetical protein
MFNMTANQSSDNNAIDPSFRLLTSSVTAIKTSAFAASKHVTLAVDRLGLGYTGYYGGGTNDNAPDAQSELHKTFAGFIALLQAHPDPDPDISDLAMGNGVLRRGTYMGDPYHIANLAVMWASVFAFCETDKGNQRQVHHLQLMQSLHSLRVDDWEYAQAILNCIMGEGKSFSLKTWRERQQRWLVNQRNAKHILAMLQHMTPDGKVALIEWALHYYNNKPSDGWQRVAGGEIATWLQMPEIILGLHFESELGEYFEVVYAWHCRAGPIHTRSGFRMLEIFDLYFKFELP